MFIIDDNDVKINLTETADYSAEAIQRSAQGEDYDELAEEYTQKFADSIKGLYDSEEDVGAVINYYKLGALVALFDYENYAGGVV
jgi:hypothetical protein